MLTWLKNFGSRILKRRPLEPRPVFIVGCGRSGTTLLFQLMRRHPGVAPTVGYPDGEDHVGWNTHGDCRISGLGYADQDRGHTGYHYCLYMDEQDVTPDIVMRMHRYYLEDVAGSDPQRRVLNKCPHLSNKLRYVRAIFPRARFVHIVRDCLPVVASWMEIMREQPGQVLHLPPTEYPCLWVLPAPADDLRERVFRHETTCYPGGGVHVLTDYWRLTNHNIPRQLAGDHSALHTVRYEDLCADPQAVLAKIFAFCELPPWEGSTEDDYGRQVDSKNDKFKQQMDGAFIADCLARAADVRAEFGYLRDGALEGMHT